MTRIVFLSAAHPAFDKRVFDKEARSLAAAGFDVIHICPADHEGAEVRHGVEVQKVKRVGGRLWRPLTLIRSFRRALAARPDALHANEVDSWLLAAFVRPITRVPVVFDAHEDYHGMVSERLPPILKPMGVPLFRALTDLASKLTWRIVLAKDSILQEYGGPSQKVVIAKNFGPVPPTQPRNKPATPPLRLVHLGLISRRRGWPQLLAALADLSGIDWHLTIVGEFNDGSEADFRARVAELGMVDRVEIEPWLPFDDAFELLVRSHVGLVLFQPGERNHIRALPHKMFDYMAAECAVVAPDFALEVASIMQESGAGILVDPADPASIAAAIRSLSDPAVRRRHGRAGRTAVEQRYNWPKEAEKLAQMYRELPQPAFRRTSETEVKA